MVKYKLTDNPILKGDFSNTPTMDSNTIRIFISSTFTDMTEERNALMRTTFPELHSYFRSKGYDFEIVDMRWGVREEMVLDHMASQLCEQQINQAQKISQGVCFIALLGDKYGSCPLPYSIPVEHYKHFVDVLVKAKIKHDLLEKWYLIDENARTADKEPPSIYVLVPLTDRFKYINSNDLTFVDQRLQEKRQWEADQNELRILLQKAATLCLQEGRFHCESEKDLYFMAVTEREISNGILKDEQAASRALCFIRSFEFFKESDESASRYADVINGRADPTSKIYLRNLKVKKIPEALPKENIFRYTIPWLSNGVCAEEDSVHQAYLNQLCDDLKRAVIELSEKRMKNNWNINQPSTDEALWHSDVLHHAEFCRSRVATYVQRRKLHNLCFKALMKNQFPLNKQFLKLKNKKKISEEETPEEPLDECEPKEPSSDDDLSNDNEENNIDNEQENNPNNVEENKRPEKNNEDVRVEEEEETFKKNINGKGDNDLNEEDFDQLNESSSDESLNNEHKGKKFFRSNRKMVSTKSLITTRAAPTVSHKPLVIYGISGCGKTSLLSHVVFNFANTFNRFLTACINANKYHRRPIDPDNLIKIVRYLGTSPLSCTIRDLLKSVITQLWLAFDCEPKNSTKILESSFSSLSAYFERFLWSFNSYSGDVLIALDAVDQLNPDDGAYNMNWLPLSLPGNVYFIISMYEPTELVNDASAICLANVKKMFPFEKCYVNVRELGIETSNDIDKFITVSQRVFTSNQKNVVYLAFKECRQAMYLKLLLDFSKDWKSFTDVSNIKFGKTCKDLIQQLFSKFETQHGKTLVYSLKYLAAARNGLTNTEMEDLLTLEDRVLQDVYVYHLPAETKIIRLPPMLWRSIRQQLNEYLTEKEADGKTLINWYHRQFWEKGKYHSSNSHGVHATMAEYFSGEWYGKPKPLILFKGKKAEYPDCIRNMPSMPNYFSATEPNLRKLNELPYHLIRSFQMDKAEDLLTDFDFLLCKLKSTSLKKILDDFRLFFDAFSPEAFDRADLAYLKIIKENKSLVTTTSAPVDDRKDIIEMKIVLEILVNAFDALASYWGNLAGQIIGRIGDDLLETYPRIRKLYEDAQRWATNASLPLILPRYTCLQQPGMLLRTTIHNVVHVPRRYRDYRSGVYFNGQYVYAREQCWDEKDVIQVYDLKNFGEQIQTIKLNYDLITMTMLKSEKFLLAKTHLKRRKHNVEIFYRIFNLLTREAVHLPISNNTNVKKIILARSENFFVALYLKVEFAIFDIGIESNAVSLRNTIQFESESDYEDGEFNLDDTTIVFVTKSGCLSAYNVSSAKCIWTNSLLVSEDNEEYSTFGTFNLHFTTTRKIIFRGLAKSNWYKLFITCENTGQLLSVCEGETHSLDIIIVHKSERWVAAATSTVDSFDTSTKTKPLFLFDIEDGRRLERIKGNRGAFKSAIFLGNNHEYIAFSRHFSRDFIRFDPGIIIVYIGTPDKPYSRGRQLLKLAGHTKAVTCFVKDPLDFVLITASDDNHIKIWDLQMILTICKLYRDNMNVLNSLDDDVDQLKIRNSNAEAEKDYVLFSGNLSKTLDKKLMGGCHANVIAISSDNKRVVTGCLFGRIVFFSLETGNFIVTQGHSVQVKRVNRVLFSTCNIGVENVEEFVVSSAFENEVRFWDPSNGKCIKTIDAGMKVGDVVLHNEYIYIGGSTIYNNEKEKGDKESVLQKYHIAQGVKLMEYKCDGGFVFADFIFVPSQNVICSWNVRRISVFEETVSDDDNSTTSLSKLLYRKFQLRGTNLFTNDNDRCGFLKATKNGLYVVCGSVRYLHIVNLASTNLEEGYIAVIDCGSNVNCLDFTQDSFFAIVGSYRKVSVVDLINGILAHQVPLHSDYIENVIVCSTGDHLITLSKDKKISLHKFSQQSLQLVDTVASFVFHCPVRHMAIPNDLTYLLVGPESAAPLAVLVFNDFLVEQLKKSIDNYTGPLEWSKFNMTSNADIEQLNDERNSVAKPVQFINQFDIVYNDDIADIYVGVNKSLSISVISVEVCKSIANPFSSSSSGSSFGSNSSCCVS